MTADRAPSPRRARRRLLAVAALGAGFLAVGTVPAVAAPAAAASASAEPAPALASAGVAPLTQAVAAPVPVGGSVVLVGAAGAPADAVDVPGGHFVLDPASGVVTFTPAPGVAGDTATVGYRLRDRDGGTASGVVTAHVHAPAAPAAFDVRSVGPRTAPQSPVVPLDVPPGGAVTLLDPLGEPATSLVTDAGTTTLDPSTGVLTFTPGQDWLGDAPAVAVRRVDALGRAADGVYTATVVPVGATPSARATSGVGTDVQVTMVVAPVGGGVALIGADGAPATSVTVDGQGVYALDPTTGTVTFSPVAGFLGDAMPALVSVTDATGEDRWVTVSPTVGLPAAPFAVGTQTTGAPGLHQVVTVPVPDGGRVTLVDAGGTEAPTVVVPGEGVYAVDAVAAAVRFAPDGGFTGAATPATVRVVDAYGQTTDATFAPTVATGNVTGAATGRAPGVDGAPTAPPEAVPVPEPAPTPALVLEDAGAAADAATAGLVAAAVVAGPARPTPALPVRVSTASVDDATTGPVAQAAPSASQPGTGSAVLTAPPSGTARPFTAAAAGGSSIGATALAPSTTAAPSAAPSLAQTGSEPAGLLVSALGLALLGALLVRASRARV
ncbi:hypothetical protein [uncultured Cellulomonas sp.]|uniref:hypothetical protein n=1 Tax=uncultured Cellulomonas sp. TaxID=189682 RepID=UPI002611B031|nr:hypothetical protein [uncultured Cellulomonas sp.]